MSIDLAPRLMSLCAPRVASETVDLPLLRTELLHRPPGWKPCLHREIADWCREVLGPVVLIGDGKDAVLRMSAGDYVAFVLRWR